MGGLTQPTLGADERETNWRAIGIGIAVVVAIIAMLIVISRTEQKRPPDLLPTPPISNFLT